MSTQNTKISSAASGEWRTLIDPEDRKASEINVYQMTKEEIEERYGPIKQRKKELVFDIKNDVKRREARKRGEKVDESFKFERGNHMANAKINREQLLELCKEHGVDKTGILRIADKVGLQKSTIRYYISKWQIRKELEEASADLDQKECEVNDDKVIQEVVDNIIDSDSNLTAERVKNAEHKEVKASSENIKSTLKPKAFISQALSGLEYTCADDVIVLNAESVHINGNFSLPYEDIPTLIQELQEIYKLA